MSSTSRSSKLGVTRGIGAGPKKSKPDHSDTTEHLQPLSIPKHLLQVLCSDRITSKNLKIILAMVWLTRFTCFRGQVTDKDLRHSWAQMNLPETQSSTTNTNFSTLQTYQNFTSHYKF
jgi:hypothetical protein